MTQTKKLIAAALLFAAVVAATAATQQQEHAQHELDKCMAAGQSACNVHSDAELVALMRKVQSTTVKHLQKRIDKCGLQPGQKLQEMLTWAADCSAQQPK